VAQDSSSDYTLPWQVNAYELFKASIPFRSAQSHGQVPAFAEFLAKQFLDVGFPAEDVHLLPMESDGEAVASLVVRYRGNGSLNKKPILFMSHMDVVDAVAEDWDNHPFEFAEDNGYFYGRGVIDNKLGTTILTTTFLRMRSEGFVPGRDLIVAFTGDEETNMYTAESLVTDYRHLVDAEFAFNLDTAGGLLDENDEPVAYYVQAAEKNYATFEISASNRGGHSAWPRADNAIFDIADAIKAIQALQFPARSNSVTREFFRASSALKNDVDSEAMQRFSEDPDDADAVRILSASPTLRGLIRTTCVPTMLGAGHAENALPRSATVTVNCRLFPGIDVDDVQAMLETAVDNPALEFNLTWRPRSAPASPYRKDVFTAIAAAVHDQHPDLQVIPYMESAATDSKSFRRIGIPSYGGYGLFLRGGDSGTHGLNEKVSVRAFYNALNHWYIVINTLAASN